MLNNNIQEVEIKSFCYSILFFILLPLFIFGQEPEFFYSDTDTIISGGESDPPVEYTPPINLTGSINVMVMVIGFPDRNNDWPVITDNNQYFPVLGAFPDGTLLSEYISVNGPVPIDMWYEPSFERYFQVHSGGMYTGDASYPKPGNGHTYLTDHTLQYWITQNGGSNNVCWNKWNEMANEVAFKILLDDPNAFTNVDLLHVTFTGITRNEFHTIYAGVALNNVYIRNPNNPSQIYYQGPAGVQRTAGAIIHESLHLIGKAVGSPYGFKGLPDRGDDKPLTYIPQDPNLPPKAHYNVALNYDVMWHSGGFPNQYSLYASTPLMSHDLVFLGWIQQNEMIVLNNQNITDLKLASITYPLTPSQISNGFVRAAKLMIHENFSGDKDEYFLIEFHDGSEFDTNLHNYDEGLYNKGVLIWHVREKVNMVNQFSDNFIDLELAVPYNGFYNNPIPNDGYPRNYQRSNFWNGNYALDYDWLDDIRRSGGLYYFMPDGGRHIWETTASPSIYPGGHYPWDPTGEDWFMRQSPLKSDFFTDEEIRGHISNYFSNATRPSSKDWEGKNTHLAITDIKRVDDYMTCNIYYNYWDGIISENTTWSGEIIVGKNLVIPENVALTIDAGTNIKFDQEGKLTVKGTVVFNGTSNDSIRITSLDGKLGYGIRIMPEEIPGYANLYMNYCSIKNLSVGVESTMENVTIRNSTFSNCTKGISLINASGLIEDNYIKNCSYGIFVNSSSPEVHDNTIRHCGYNGIYILAGSGTYLKNVISECGYLDVPKPGGFLAIEGSSPILEYEDGGLLALNEIIDNFGFGIHASDNTNIFAGSNEEIVTGNSMFNNRIYDAEALYTSTIYAMNNWWGTPEPSDKQFHTDFEGIILYEPWMEEPPEGESLNAGSNLEKISESQSIPLGMAPENTAWKKLLLKYLKNHNHQQLIALGKSLLQNSLSYRDASMVISFLQHSSLFNNDSLLIPYLKTFSNLTTNIKMKRFVSALLVENYLHFGKIDQAVNIINQILNQYPNSSIEAFALLKKFHVNLHYKNDISAAEQNYIELKNNYPNHTYTELAINELNAAQCILSPQPTIPKHQKVENIKIVAPRAFALNQNYPNPFNPQTTIKFSLPEKDRVSIQIYNTLGQNVKTFDLGYLDSGDHQIIWNGVDDLGTQVASGIYIYELKTSVYRQMKKMLLIR